MTVEGDLNIGVEKFLRKLAELGIEILDNREVSARLGESYASTGVLTESLAKSLKPLRAAFQKIAGNAFENVSIPEEPSLEHEEQALDDPKLNIPGFGQ
jgi:hypothetical protein